MGDQREASLRAYVVASCVGPLVAGVAALVGEGAAWAWIVIGLGLGLGLAGGVGRLWQTRSDSAVRSARVVAISALLLGLLVGSVQAARNDDAPVSSSAATPTTTWVPSTTAPLTVTVKAGKYGWGAYQPPIMRKILYGTSDKAMTPARRELLGRELSLARAAALNIGTLAHAKELGYKRATSTSNGGRIEYVNYELSKRFDVSRPTMAVFAEDKPDARIISIAYNVEGSYKDGPPKYFPLEAIPWHYHYNICWKGDGYIGDQFLKDCAGAGGQVRPELSNWMVDLWVVPGWENPWGLVSSKHPYLFPPGYKP